MTPGIDGVIEIRFPVMESGKYEYVVYSNNQKIFTYPLFIDVIQTEEKDRNCIKIDCNNMCNVKIDYKEKYI
ncbi:hypothetical protein LQK80_34900 [Bacillus thuringiensis]|nr:hypothetical protein [Bacillus thuringiensis]